MYKLRELSRKDIIQINVWRNDQDLIALLGAPFRYINLDVDTDWFEAYMGNRENTIRCAVVQDASDEILGLVSLTGIDWVSRSAEFHIMIGNKENRRHGIGMFATRAMLNHAFGNMNLHRVELGVLEDNIAAQHLYEKIGFVREGTKREATFKAGQYKNMYIYAILRNEDITR